MKILFLLVAAALWSPAVLAQDALPVTPSRGINLPYSSVAAQDDATSLEVNPAGLAFMETGEFGVGFEAPSTDFQEINHDSLAFLLAWGNGVIGTGFGFQDLEQPAGGTALDHYRKYTWGIALALPKRLSLGLNVNWFGSSDSQRLDELTSYDLGLQWRLGEHLAFGLVFRDVNQPFLNGQATRLSTLFGIHLRLFNGRLQLDSSSTSFYDIDAFEWTPRIMIEPLAGLRLFASAKGLIDNRLDDRDFSWEEFSAGLELSFGSFGLAYAPSYVNTDDGYKYGSIRAYHWFSPSKQRGIYNRDSRWITMNLNQSIGEAGYSGGILSSGSRAFLEFVVDLERASNDPTVEGILIISGESPLGYAQAWELHEAVKKLRTKGKKVVTYMTQQTNRDYYVATASDQIWVYPTEPFNPDDVHARLVSYRGVLQKVGVEAEFMRVGEYKSAPEALTHDEPSEQSLEQTGAIIKGIQEAIRAAWFDDRHQSKERIEALSADRPLFPTEALKAGWIDAVLYPDELEDHLREAYPGARLELGYEQPNDRDQNWRKPKEIAILVIEGNIVSGRSSRGLFSAVGATGGQTIQEAAQDLANNPNVAAVVVRVNSSGGSAVASDQMFRAIQLLAKKKPVIASMSNIAASGGYYAAASAREVYATPLTITGSIGIFTGKFNAASLFKWIGVKSRTVGEGQPYSDIYQPWTDDERRRTEADMLYRYNTFLAQIATTRALTADEFDKVGRGHVWLGSAAVANRIVDHPGGLLDAIRRAESIAGIPENEATYKIYPKSGLSITASIGTSMSSWLGLNASEDAHQAGALKVLQRVLKSAEANAVLPLLHGSEEALMLPYDYLIVE